MTDIQKDDTKEVEGEYQTPKVRQKVFNSVGDLCEFLLWTKHNKIKIETHRNSNGRFSYLLQWEG